MTKPPQASDACLAAQGFLTMRMLCDLRLKLLQCFFGVQLASIGLQNEETYRRELREFLFSAPGVAECISGVVRASSWFAGRATAQNSLTQPFRCTCEHTERSTYLTVVLRPQYCFASQILFEETLYQDGSDGTPLVEVLQRQGIVPGALAAAETWCCKCPSGCLLCSAAVSL